MIKKIYKTNLFILSVIFIILISSLCFYIFQIKKHKVISNFEDSISNLSEDISNPVFEIDKIILYSNIDTSSSTSSSSSLSVSLSQYTDIAIYIKPSDNKALNSKNIIKEAYIDNINFINPPSIGKPSLYKKSLLDFGKNTFDADKLISDRLYFNITNSNIDYNNNELSYDCTTPITIGYINNNLKENYILPTNVESIQLDGSLLKKANILLNDINATISFNINVINELGEHYLYSLNLPLTYEDDTSSIYDGAFYKELNYENNSAFYRVYS